MSDRRAALAILAVGALFGAGLALSGMIDPRVVLGFLTLGPGFDPRLLFVMGAALLVAWPGYRWATGRQPVFAEQCDLPTARRIDGPLVLGALVFGLGWGLAGYCPGPAIAALPFNPIDALPFVVAMFGGWWLADKWL